MRLLCQRRGASTYAILLTLIVVSGTCYAMATADEDRPDGRAVVVISEHLKTEFLAFVRRQKIKPSSFSARVSVGDRLPEFGITYYLLPLGYGYPFYRYASVGTQIVIVDRFSGDVIQVLD